MMLRHRHRTLVNRAYGLDQKVSIRITRTLRVIGSLPLCTSAINYLQRIPGVCCFVPTAAPRM